MKRIIFVSILMTLSVKVNAEHTDGLLLNPNNTEIQNDIVLEEVSSDLTNLNTETLPSEILENTDDENNLENSELAITDDGQINEDVLNQNEIYFSDAAPIMNYPVAPLMMYYPPVNQDEFQDRGLIISVGYGINKNSTWLTEKPESASGILYDSKGTLSFEAGALLANKNNTYKIGPTLEYTYSKSSIPEEDMLIRYLAGNIYFEQIKYGIRPYVAFGLVKALDLTLETDTYNLALLLKNDWGYQMKLGAKYFLSDYVSIAFEYKNMNYYSDIYRAEDEKYYKVNMNNNIESLMFKIAYDL